MRQFKIKIVWQNTNHTDTITHIFDPSHTKKITPDEFLSLLAPCVSLDITSCTTEAQDYIKRYFLDDSQAKETKYGTIQSVEEIDA
tara:strand:+ start:604 stop:861 length:258 start_codon:yes stop_codon:yes gene_type:complete